MTRLSLENLETTILSQPLFSSVNYLNSAVYSLLYRLAPVTGVSQVLGTPVIIQFTKVVTRHLTAVTQYKIQIYTYIILGIILLC